jgi:hypothetical protein
MRVRIETFREAYRVAHAAGWDAADRRARRAGRSAWNDDDRSHAVAEFRRVIRQLGFGDGGCTPDDTPLSLAARERSTSNQPLS